jgi:cytochrome c oxidase assembly protein subunit 11
MQRLARKLVSSIATAAVTAPPAPSTVPSLYTISSCSNAISGYHGYPRWLSSKPMMHSPKKQSNYTKQQSTSSEHGIYLVAMVVGMVGLTYASVPLYRMFCQATGFGGTIKEGASVEEKLKARQEASRTVQGQEVEKAAAERELTIRFNADVSDGLEWKFTPTQRSLKIHPGQSTLAFYTVENLTDKAITGVSTYNVTPQQVGQYFNKVQCFCFEEQRLRPREKIDMPVFFYIDPEYATDRRVDHINTITLSYTFFKVSEDSDDE